MKNVYSFVILLISLSINKTVVGQSDDFIIISPNDNFSSIKIQGYNGLPRFGLLDGFDVSLKRNYTHKTPTELAQQDLIKWNYKKYFALVELFFFNRFYDKLSTDRLLYYANFVTNQGNKDLEYNFIAQKHLLGISPILSTDKTFKLYFKNPSDRSSYLNFSGTWGGRGSDEFRQLDLFRDFTNKHLDNLRSWSSNFWPNDSVECYLVSAISVSSDYDFTKNGLWFRIYQKNITEILKENTDFIFSFQGYSNNRFPTKIANIEYIEQNEYENIEHIEILLSLTQEKAKMLKNENGSYPHFYLVQKIKIELSKISSNRGNGALDFSYSISSPEIEIHPNTKLNNKITTLNYKNLIYR